MSDKPGRPDDLKETIRQHYAEAARSAGARPAAQGCCAGGATGPEEGCCGTPHYDLEALRGLPQEVINASRGCGNPHALLELVPGEVVLDLGSGGGIDVFLAARRVGPTGFVYGLDMTDEMLELARHNQRRAGIINVEFLKGDLEAIPLPDASVDVVISNCVINLAADKDRALREAVRVLRPGGRFAVYDTLFQGDTALLPEVVRSSPEAWACCVAGALEERDYLRRMEAAGLVDVTLQITRTHVEGLPSGIRLASGFLRGRRSVPPGWVDQVELRPGDVASETELASVRRLLRENNLPVPDSLDEQFILACADGRVVGGAGLELPGRDAGPHAGRVGLLRSVVVDSPYRGRGIAEALVRDRLAWGRARGVREVYLLTETAPEYFPRLGFASIERCEAPEPIRRTEEFRELCSQSSVLMLLNL